MRQLSPLIARALMKRTRRFDRRVYTVHANLIVGHLSYSKTRMS